MDDEVYCRRVQQKARTHLIRCSLDDSALALMNVGYAAVELCRAVKQNFEGVK